MGKAALRIGPFNVLEFSPLFLCPFLLARYSESISGDYGAGFLSILCIASIIVAVIVNVYSFSFFAIFSAFLILAAFGVFDARYTVVALIVLLAVWYSIKFVSDNIYFLRLLYGKGSLWEVARQSICLWFPMVIPIAIGTSAAWYVSTLPERTFYEFVVTPPAPGNGFAADVDREIDLRVDRLVADITHAASVGVEGTQTTSQIVFERVRSNLLAIRPYQFGLPSCRWYQFSCRAKRTVLRRTNRTIEEAHNAIVSGLLRQLQETTGTANDLARKGKAGIDAEIKGLGDQVRREVKDFANWVFFSFALISAITLLLTWISVIKSVSAVVGRVAFRPDGPLELRFVRHARPRQTARFRVFKNAMSPRIRQGEAWYFRDGYQPNGAPPSKQMVQPFNALLSRLRHGAYRLHETYASADRDRLKLNIDARYRVVVVSLSAGDIVYFRMRDFIGMSAGITLNSEFSLDVGRLTFDQAIFNFASGPGKLLLRALDEVAIHREGVRLSSYVPTDFVAWHAFAPFSVQSQLNRHDVFMSGVRIKTLERAKAVAQASSGGRTGSGIVRYVFRFLIPW